MQPLMKSDALDLEHATLSKQRRDLALHLRNLSAAFDATAQALKIMRAKQSNDLETSINRWQAVARDVAEHLFMAVKDHVNDTGSVAVYHEKHDAPMESPQWRLGTEIDTSQVTDEQKEQFEVAQEEIRAEAEKYDLYEPQQLPINNCEKVSKIPISSL